MPVVGVVVTVTTRDDPIEIELEPTRVSVAPRAPFGVTTLTVTGLEIVIPPTLSVAVAVIIASPAVEGVQLTVYGGVVSEPIGVPLTEN
jgi:hypothetical protein